MSSAEPFEGGFIGDVLGGCIEFCICCYKNRIHIICSDRMGKKVNITCCCCKFAAAWAAWALRASNELPIDPEPPIDGGPKITILH